MNAAILRELAPLEEQAEHQREWHQFLTYALMVELTTPERVVERIVDELDAEAAQASSTPPEVDDPAIR